MGLAACCDHQAAGSPPCKPDGRRVSVYLVDSASDKEAIKGELVGWQDGWVSLRREGRMIHIAVRQVRSILESGG